jgi:hypothetical protein
VPRSIATVEQQNERIAFLWVVVGRCVNHVGPCEAIVGDERAFGVAWTKRSGIDLAVPSRAVWLTQVRTRAVAVSARTDTVSAAAV